jgi:hypothetical protein
MFGLTNLEKIPKIQKNFITIMLILSDGYFTSQDNITGEKVILGSLLGEKTDILDY